MVTHNVKGIAEGRALAFLGFNKIVLTSLYLSAPQHCFTLLLAIPCWLKCYSSVALDQNICWDAKCLMQLADHLQGQFTFFA